MKEVLDLPVLLGGKRITSTRESMRFTYEDGWEVVVPEITLADLVPVLEGHRVRRELAAMQLDDITIFLQEVSKAWRDAANPWRKLALVWGARITGYSQDIVNADVDLLGSALLRSEIYDLIETDLGDPGVLDEWTRYKAVYHRAWPKGLVAHILVGNVPMAGLFTMLRSLVTKNATVAKVSSRDVVVPQCFAQCIHDVDPTHPVTRALSTVYWKPESEIENAVLDRADVVTVWGRASSIESIKRRLRYGVDLVEFGPKRSFAVVLEGVTDWDRMGLWLGLDIVAYNQEGCFSTQEIYVVGDPTPLATALAAWLDRYAQSAAVGAVSRDVQAHVQRARLDAAAEGWEVRAAADTGWTVVVTEGPVRLATHPLMRFVYVHPIQHVGQIESFIDDNVQTVTVEPFSRVWEVADRLTGLGADRIVSPGRTARTRPGFIHDGFHPMRRMVRWSTIERGTDYKYRFNARDPEEEERFYRQWASGSRTYTDRRTHTYRPYATLAKPDL